MESLSPDSWELARPNVVAWTIDLSSAPSSVGTNRAIDRLYALGQRIDALSRAPVADFIENVADVEEEVGDPQEEAVEEEPEVEDEYVLNETSVSFALSFQIFC